MASTTRWQGYWEQRIWGGRQAMHDVVLWFDNGALRGEGVDCVGRFTFDGTHDANGSVVMVKQYLGKHQVLYRGEFDGEGTIFGRWSIWPFDAGEFVLTIARDEAIVRRSRKSYPWDSESRISLDRSASSRRRRRDRCPQVVRARRSNRRWPCAAERPRSETALLQNCRTCS